MSIPWQPIPWRWQHIEVPKHHIYRIYIRQLTTPNITHLLWTNNCHKTSKNERCMAIKEKNKTRLTTRSYFVKTSIRSSNVGKHHVQCYRAPRSAFVFLFHRWHHKCGADLPGTKCSFASKSKLTRFPFHGTSQRTGTLVMNSGVTMAALAGLPSALIVSVACVKMDLGSSTITGMGAASRTK
jgi:hypothetical protein